MMREKIYEIPVGQSNSLFSEQNLEPADASLLKSELLIPYYPLH